MKIADKMLPMGIRFFAFAVVFLVILLNGDSGNGQESNKIAAPAIQITSAPDCGGGPGNMKRIAGFISRAVPADHRVVIYSRTDKWYVQPFSANPYTGIAADGTWGSNIHLGQEYAALLVQPSYRPPAVVSDLPQVGGQVVAVGRASCSGR
ncbi:MAG: hypothetical protein C4576_35380 [Desulfobacteraceae bacterium]|nr:MAG: hypothetical protein C4576_35380 [Desulfobacteraceae bacterium]